ncbi:MAG: RNA-binding protein [Pyrobaculum sp.]
MKRVRLSNREVRELRELYKHISPILEGSDVVEVAQLGEETYVYIIDGEILFAKIVAKELGEHLIPTLYLIHKSEKVKLLPPYPKAVVDAGAVKHIINGADVMRPGIRELSGEFNKGDVVLVADEKGRAIAVAVALFSKSEIEQMQKGKVLINLHYIGDKIWRASLEMLKK